MTPRIPAFPVLTIVLATLLGVVTALHALANPGRDVRDPVYVYYPSGSCLEETMSVQVWDRTDSYWKDHPLHPVIPVNSCQLEDAGRLLQEIRWRCIERKKAPLAPAWVVGLEVFNPNVMDHCAGAQRLRARDEAEIVISSPRPDELVRSEDPNVRVEGQVRIGGLEGARYDVIVALDVSRRVSAGDGGVDAFAAEVEAARALIKRHAKRLGDVRFGIVTFPNRRVSRNDPGGTGARRDARIGASFAQLDRALRNVRARGNGSFQSFAAGLDFALDELLGENYHSGARPDARKVLVIAADGRGDLPFGAGASETPEFQRRFEASMQRAHDRDVAVHLFALSGAQRDTHAFVDSVASVGRNSFHRIPPPQLGAGFFESVSLPYVGRVEVVDLRTGEPLRNVRTRDDGRFAATLAAEGGPNPLRITGVTSEGERIDREYVVNFDDSLFRERLLAAERERMKRVRERLGRVEIEAR